MSHSKGTTNYNLPLFTKDDRPAWLTDFNSAMQEVDAVMKRTSDAARPDLLEAAQQEAAAALEKATDAQTKANGALQKSGGAMNGTLDMNEHAITNVQEVELPTSGNGLYVGSVVQPDGTGGARLTGITGNGAAFVKPDTTDSYVPVRVGAPQTGDDAVNKNSLNGTLSSYMKKSGATMTGALMLSGEPTENLQAATKKYVDDAVASMPTPTGGITQEQADARYVQLAGGTMTGALTLSGAPTSDLQAATKKYVDDAVGGATLVLSNHTLKSDNETLTLPLSTEDFWKVTSVIVELTNSGAANLVIAGKIIFTGVTSTGPIKLKFPILGKYGDGLYTYSIQNGSTANIIRVLKNTNGAITIEFRGAGTINIWVET